MNWTRRDVIPIAALSLIGACAFMHLLAVPAFEDEGSQIRWIQRILAAGEWLQPLNEGKPLEAWPMVPFVWMGLPALVVARVLHVLAGIAAAVLTYRLALPIAGRRLAFASGALFALCPFAVYLQRFALSDMFLCAASVAVLVSVLALLESRTWGRAATLGLSLVLAAFAKFPVGFAFLIAMPLALLLMPAVERRRLWQQPGLSRLLLAQAPVIALVLAVMLFALVRTRHGRSPGFGLRDFAGIGLGRYSDIPTVIGIAPLNLVDELTTQLTWPVTVLALMGLIAGTWLGDWRQRWLIAMGMAPLLGIGLLAAFWFPRYLLFSLPPLIIGAVCGWRALLGRCGAWGPPIAWAVWTACAILMGHQSALIIFNPLTANWSPVDRFQYFEGWSSGYGYPEAARFVLAAANAPRMIYSLDGHSAYQLQAYLPSQWSRRVSPIFYGPDGAALRGEGERLANLLAGAPAWIIISPQLLHGYLDSSFGRANLDQFDLRQVAVFDKPGSRSQVALYQATRR